MSQVNEDNFKRISYLATFPETNPMPVVEFDIDGNIKYANPATKSLFPDIFELGNQHPFLTGWKNIIEEFKSKKPLYIFRQIKVGDSWYGQNISYFSETNNFRIYSSNITQRRTAEEELRNNSERLRKVEEIAQLGSWELDLERNVLTWSDEVYRIFGLKPQEFSATYEAFLEHIHPDDRKAVDNAYAGSLREGRDSYEIEHRVIRKGTGEIRWVYEKCEHVRNQKGKIVRSVGMVQDVTENRFIERAFEETSNYLENLFNYANAPIIVWNPSFKITKFNHAFEKMTGYKAREVIGKDLTILFPEETKLESLQKIERTATGEYWESIEIPILHKDKTIKTALWNSANIYEKDVKLISSTIAQGQDITERKKIELEIQRERDVNKIITENTETQLAYFDKEFNFIDVNSAFLKFQNMKREELIGKNYFIVFPDRENQIIFEKVRSSAEKLQFKAKPFISNAKGKKMTTYWDWVIAPVKNESADLIGLVLSLTDVTESIKNGQMFEEYSQNVEREKVKDEALLSSIGDGIIALDNFGKVLFLNDAFSSLVGKSKEELMHKKANEVTQLYNRFGDLVPFEKRPFYIALLTGKKITISSIAGNEYYYYREDGVKIPLSITACPIVLDNNVIGAISEYRDISRDIEIDKAKSDFISIVAHQLRTPMAEMSMNLEMILKGFTGEVSKEVKKYLKSFFKDIHSMNQLVKTFLDVSRLDLGTLRIKPVPTDIIKIADGVVKNLMPQIKNKKLKFSKKFKNMPILEIDPKMFTLTLENIISNSIDYTPEKGSISIKITKKESSVIITVKDTGCGIPEKEQTEIFNKLFRASNVMNKNGTGLGLYIAKYSIEKCNGKIWFESKENKGTTFYISLPINSK